MVTINIRRTPLTDKMTVVRVKYTIEAISMPVPATKAFEPVTLAEVDLRNFRGGLHEPH
jgi:hypothetical protein